MAAAAGPISATEVPISGDDRIHWLELTVPSCVPPPQEPVAPIPSRDAASCHVIPGNPPAYLIWRIHKNCPNVLEVVEFFACKEYPETGLRLVFKDVLCPFAFLCKKEIQNAAGNTYLLYVLTVSGVSYCLNLRSPFTYVSGSIFPRDELVEYDIQTNTQVGKVTAVAATPGCLLSGRQDGSIVCYQLGIINPHKPEFSYELRDDVGIGRLWNMVSRAKVAGTVQDMLISNVCGRKLLFALHSDGSLRIWDLATRTRVLNHSIGSRELTETAPSRLWVADAYYDTDLISLAVLHEGDAVSDVVAVYNFSFIVGDKIILSPEPSVQIIRLEEERLVDLKISSGNLWILKEDGSMLYDLSHSDCKMEHAVTYGLQEDFLADQLFQGSEHTLEDLIWSNSSILSLMKDQIAEFISALFLRRLFQPGVHQNASLRAIIADHKKYISNHEFQSLTVSGLKKEIMTVIEGEGVAVNSTSVVYYWKNFCAHFFRYWCQNNMPYALFVDPSSGAIGVIRKSSVSLFRSLDGFEKLLCNSSSYDEFQDLKNSGLVLQEDEIDYELLFEVLKCMNCISHQLGRAALAIFYESIVSSIISSDDVLYHVLKILENGYSTSLATSLISQVGVDTAWEKKQSAHRSQRKFSVYMLLSLHALRARATSWSKVLDVIEKYLNNLNPQKSTQTCDFQGTCNINSSLVVQATSQFARVMFESAFDMLMLLGYLVNISGQVDLMQTDITRIKHQLIPRIQEILTRWVIIHYLGITPTDPPNIDDFSSRLSSLHIGNNTDQISMGHKLGLSDFTLACLLGFHSSNSQEFPHSVHFPKPREIIRTVLKFSSIIMWGKTDELSFLSKQAIELVSILLQHGQYEAAETLFTIIDAYSSKRRVDLSVQHTDGEWCSHLHLLGFCLLLRAQNGLHGPIKEQKIHEAIRCFFRVASGCGGSQSLQDLPFQTGFVYAGDSGSAAVWKLHYYQWAMQIFEQYGCSEGACQFALAALEQVDEVPSLSDGTNDDHPLFEPETTIRGRLWANVFKFTLDLKNFRDAYCAIISNPDEDSKYVCLRRFIIVLCELGATKVLCDGKLPFVGLVEKVEQELVWKAERSDISTRPNLYKLLYAFEAYRNNWRKAASYMYRYTMRLRTEATSDEKHHLSSALQEIVLGLSTTLNALQLVDRAYAWIDSGHESSFVSDQGSPNKRARSSLTEISAVSVAPQLWRLHCYVDLEMLEKEYVLTSAQYLLTLANDNLKVTGNQTLANLVDHLIEGNLYDMAFTVVLKFWKGSGLKRELERAFVAITQKCCSDRLSSSYLGSNMRANNLLLQSSEDRTNAATNINASLAPHHFKGNGQWETLEFYLEKYKMLHPRLPVTVAETLLHTDPQIELPLWLVHMFKGGRRASSWGMTGQESDPATLFRLYVDYSRHAEATNLLLEYLDSFVSMKAADIINKKKMAAVWFPYNAIERLWCQLEELQSAGHMVDQCDKLKRLLQGALLNHLKQLKIDSEDALFCQQGQQTQNSNS